MNFKQQLQQDLREAMRANDQQRINVIRMILAKIENTQEAMGKEAFVTFNSDGTNIQPDRNQTLREKDIHEIILIEVANRRETVALFRSCGQKKQVEIEEAEIAILEDYLTRY